jgi:hypothetical protein
VCEVTNGRFVEAKLEKPALGIGQLWRSLTGGYGSDPANQSPELVARNQPVELGCHTADVRLDRLPTLSGHPVQLDSCGSFGYEADKHMAHTAVSSNDLSGRSYLLRLETAIELRTAIRD